MNTGQLIGIARVSSVGQSLENKILTQSGWLSFVLWLLSVIVGESEVSARRFRQA